MPPHAAHVPGKTRFHFGHRRPLRAMWISPIRNLARQFDSLGADRAAIEVKLFGGADVFGVFSQFIPAYRRRLNAESALRILSDEGFAI